MGLLSASMLAEMAKLNPSIRNLLTITFPDGDRRYSDVAACSASLGYFEPRIRRWGTIPKNFGDIRNALVVPEWRVEILDHDKDWSNRSAKYDLKGSAAVFKRASANVAQASWLTRFSGILYDWDFADEMVISATFRPNDLALTSPFQRTRITRQDFPNLPKESENLYVPLCYGRHDSFGLGNVDGQIKPLYVGEYTGAATGSRYLICLGRIKRILHAYSDGVRLQETTWDADPTFLTINGRTYSVINFETNRSAQEITLDVEGYTFVADGSATLITNPSAQIQHWLVNFVFNEYQSGSWFSFADPHIDSSHTGGTSDYLTSLIPTGYVGSRYFPASEDPALAIEALNEWSASNEIRPFWTSAGQLAWRLDILDDPGYISSPWFRREYDELDSGPLRPTVSAQDGVRRIVIEGAYGAALGQYQEKLEIVSQETDEESTDTIQCPWGPAFI